MMKAKEIITTLYKNYTLKHWKKIVTSLLLSVLVAGSTSAIAWLLDPAIKKLFIRVLQTLFVVVVALTISLQHQRIKSCEDSIEDIQKIIYLDWKIEIYEKMVPPPDNNILPLPKLYEEDDL